LAEGAFHLGVMVHHQLVKIIITMFTVIFKNRHNFPPYLPSVNKKISSPHEVCKKENKEKRILIRYKKQVFQMSGTSNGRSLVNGLLPKPF
jgi:hypothetical protein